MFHCLEPIKIISDTLDAQNIKLDQEFEDNDPNQVQPFFPRLDLDSDEPVPFSMDDPKSKFLSFKYLKRAPKRMFHPFHKKSLISKSFDDRSYEQMRKHEEYIKYNRIELEMPSYHQQT